MLVRVVLTVRTGVILLPTSTSLTGVRAMNKRTKYF
jgi:hypothetical protein